MRRLLYIIVFVIINFTSFPAHSTDQLKELNIERKHNGLKPIVDVNRVDEIIQDELDQRLEINEERINQKLSPLPAMPITEKLGEKNIDRASKRKAHIKAAQAARDHRP